MSKRKKKSNSGSESDSSDEETKLLKKDQEKKEDVPGGEEKIPYPKSVAFIVGNEFCERFTYYGMRTILVIYLVNELAYSENTATIIYHLFTVLAYFTPVFGAIIADSWLGKFKTILYLSILYCIGCIVTSVGAIPNELNTMRAVSLLGLFVLSLGTGGIKPCVSAFGGDQFRPGQEEQLQRFFSLFYISINLGSVVSTALTPILREDVKCFEKDSCFSVAFGVPAALMIVALCLFISGKPFYRINPPEGNILVKVSKCICTAISNKVKRKKTGKKKEHWLDYADDKFERQLIEDIKILFHILVLYIPLPLFWALFDQQASRWTLQATRMDGVVGSFNIKPDQMQVFNPFLIVALIPVFDYGIYPILKKFNLLTKSLQRMALGGFLTAISFGIAGFIELKIESGMPVLPSPGHSELIIINNTPCPLNIQGTYTASLEKFQSEVFNEIPLDTKHSWEVFTSCDYITKNLTANFTSSAPIESIMLTFENNEIRYVKADDSKEKNDKNEAKVRVFYSTDQKKENVSFLFESQVDGRETIIFPNSSLQYGITDYSIVPHGLTKMYLNSGANETSEIAATEFFTGASYIVYLYQNSEKKENSFNIHTVVHPNKVHLLLQIPQYLIITAGEIMFSITGLEFSYSQAPASMKSVMQASWLLTVAFGNLIVLIITELNMFDKQSHELFGYAGLMALAMLIFSVQAYFYKYVGKSSSAVEIGPKQVKNKVTQEDETDFNK